MRRKAKSGLSLRAREKRERQRRDILAAARGILAEDGIESVTLAAIADELGLTKQALYYYFPGKEALMGSLATSLLDEEIDAILAAVEQEQNRDRILGVLIDAFYRHYIGQLAVFRAIYCQSQLATWLSQGFDEETLRSEVNPRTRHLFDVLESRLSRPPRP